MLLLSTYPDGIKEEYNLTSIVNGDDVELYVLNDDGSKYLYSKGHMTNDRFFTNVSYDESGNIEAEYEYNEFDEIVKQINNNPYIDHVFNYVFQYDENNNIIYRIQYDEDGNLSYGEYHIRVPLDNYLENPEECESRTLSLLEEYKIDVPLTLD